MLRDGLGQDEWWDGAGELTHSSRTSAWGRTDAQVPVRHSVSARQGRAGQGCFAQACKCWGPQHVCSRRLTLVHLCVTSYPLQDMGFSLFD